MKIRRLWESDKIKVLYLGVFLLLCIVSLSLLSTPIQMIFHETDFWWMIPTLSHISQHNSFWKTVEILIFNPALTNYGEPSMNLYLFLIYYFLGFKVQYFIFMSMILHLCCVFFLYRILRRIGFSFQITFLAVLIYAFSFFHSLYFLWPMAAQHLIAILFMLLTLNLFFETNYRFDHGLPWRVIFWQALIVNFLASFCQISILVLPVGIFLYILCCSGNHATRIKRYDIWLPLFVTYLGHPLIRSLFVGHPSCYQSAYWSIFKKILSHVPFFGSLTLNASLEINPVILYLLSFVAVTVGLFSLRFLLKISLRRSFFIFLKRIMLTGAIFCLIIFLLVWRCRNIVVPIGVGIPLPDFISPYNFIRPLAGVFISFLNPIRTALSMNASVPYYYIPIRNDIAWIALFMLFLVIFLKNVYFKYKPLIFFVIIYIFALPLLTQISLWEMKNSIPSRYFVYITPLFAVIFSSAVSLIYDFFMNKVKISVLKKGLILLIFFSAVCFLNILAVKLILAKDKLPNGFLNYDYNKGANLIKQSLDDTKNGVCLKDICVEGVLPMPFLEYEWNFSPANPLDLDTFKYTLAQVLNDKGALNICIDNHGYENKKKTIYIFDKTGVINQKGQTVDSFLRRFYEAQKELKLENYQRARILFEEAAKIRPFFFQFFLSNRSLEDILWMANGRSAHALINDTANLYRSWVSFRVDKVEYIADMLDKEMKDYIECFFYLSYLSYLEKKLPESHHWYSRIRFIDDRNDEVLSFLNQQPMIKSDPEIQKYINEIKNNPSYKKKEDPRFSSIDVIFKLFYDNRS